MGTDPLCTLSLNNVMDTWLVELLSIENDRYQRTVSKSRAAKQKMFVEGDQVLVARGQILSSFKENAALSSKFYGPYTVIKADHPSYRLRFTNSSYSHQGIHARRLVKFYERPSLLRWN